MSVLNFECPLWVISGPASAHHGCPLHPKSGHAETCAVPARNSGSIGLNCLTSERVDVGVGVVSSVIFVSLPTNGHYDFYKTWKSIPPDQTLPSLIGLRSKPGPGMGLCMSAFGRSANRCLAGRDPGGWCPVRQQRGILDSALRWVTNGPVQQSPSCSNRPESAISGGASS